MQAPLGPEYHPPAAGFDFFDPDDTANQMVLAVHRLGGNETGEPALKALAITKVP